MPEGLEIERKFLVKRVTEGWLQQDLDMSVIRQTYLKPSDEFPCRRIRARAKAADVMYGSFTYTYTEKRAVSDTTRVENEREISELEYYRLLDEEADPLRETVRKVRYTFDHAGRTWDLDLFHSPQHLYPLMLLEVELEEEDEAVGLPHFIEIEREVTGEACYTNQELARRPDRIANQASPCHEPVG